MTAGLRPCLRCHGSGVSVRDPLIYTDNYGKTIQYPRIERICVFCKGAKMFSPLDVSAILSEIKGKAKGLCSKRPKSSRGYYTWRVSRFHGGVDVTMPVAASLEIEGDPFRKELDALADAVAKRVFGTDLTAAHRWGRALGYLGRDLGGLPASAYSGGPVADGDKPEEESEELR